MIWTPWRDTRVRGAALAASVAVLALLNEARLAFEDRLVVPVPALHTSAVANVAAVPAEPPFAIGSLFGLATRAKAGSAPSTPNDVAPITLMGTIVGSDTPAAVCQRGSAPPVILHVGDTISGWRLQHVAPAAAIFIDAAGTRHELRLSPSGN